MKSASKSTEPAIFEKQSEGSEVRIGELTALAARQSEGAPSADPKKHPVTFQDLQQMFLNHGNLVEGLRALAKQIPTKNGH